ncbi:hypothetical protein CLV30_12854 [Haloactinopolyspora alba]|uniref:Uncharacterized protein n=1 Tax=Haloactinopolyspora alba TaxID=648780 RepID=A0A2P8DF19_9ACTN|nr:hypothetical protein CLV30_12854 [Haloactinopolyspora alba]
MRWLFKALRVKGDVQAASRGPSAYAKRRTRRAAHRGLARFLRKL